ncbi:MAG TPA: sensor domain-containing diguanylate cyclase [Thermoleophilaceae bacterium]
MRRAEHLAERRRRALVLILCTVLCALITVLRFAVANPVESIGFLYTIPVAMIAVEFGAGAGIGAALATLGLTVMWAETRDVPLGLVGYAARASTLAAIGGIVGTLAKQRERVEQDRRRWFSMSNDLLSVANFDGRYTHVNEAWTTLLGYSRAELLGRAYTDFVHPDDVERTNEEAAALGAGPHVLVNFENRYRAADGSWCWLLWSARSDSEQIYAVAKDITERKRLEQEREELVARLEQAVRRDPLTGLANRRAWDDQFAVELRRAARSGEPLSLVMIDLDNLKTVNDQQGHQAGDRLLRGSAAAWRECIRETDFIARIGGDEFAILLPDCAPEEAQRVLGRMAEGMRDRHSFSAGVALWDGEEPSTELVRRADEALYAAKASGRGCVRVSAATLLPHSGRSSVG